MQAKVKAGSTQPLVVTANRLRDGRVVWLAGDGGWAEAAGDAQVFAGTAVEAGLATGAQAEHDRKVVGVYSVAVTVGAEGPVPLGMREAIRAAGPSIQAGIAA